MGVSPETVVATAHPTPTAPNPADLEKQILDKLFPGKNFKNLEEAQRSYWELVNNQAKLADLLANSPAAPPSPVYPAQPPADPFARLQAETLMPADLLKEAILSVVGSTMKQEFGPIAAALQARDAMVTKYADFNEVEPKVLAFLEGNPELKQRTQRLTAQGFAFDAHELAYNAYKWANPAPSNPVVPPSAGLPGSPAMPNRTASPITEDRVTKMNEALQHAVQTGDDRAVWMEHFKDFKPILPPEYQNG